MLLTPPPLLRCLTLAFALLNLTGLTSSAWAQLPAARVMSVTGSAKAVDAQGRERQLEKGAEVRSGEKIVTADGALVQMRLNDGGFMSVRSGTEMVIDRFSYDEKNASNSSFLVSLVRGGFRSITGLIGKTNPDAYQIRTATATVGIRGTDHEPMVIPEGVPGMAAMGAPGFYDKVNDGETFIRNRTGMLSLKRGEVGFAGVIADRAPQMLQRIPEFYKVDVKVDAREVAGTSDGKGDANRKAADGSGSLRPTLSARREALAADGVLDTSNTKLLNSSTLNSTTLKSGAISTIDMGSATLSTDKVISPSTATLLSPVTATTVTPLATTALVPATTLVAPSTTLLIAPTTTLIAPLATSTIIAPTTTLIAPVTTTIAPTTTLIAPTTSTILLSPTTTIKSTTLLK